jgi:hypothetical protein
MITDRSPLIPRTFNADPADFHFCFLRYLRYSIRVHLRETNRDSGETLLPIPDMMNGNES